MTPTGTPGNLMVSSTGQHHLILGAGEVHVVMRAIDDPPPYASSVKPGQEWVITLPRLAENGWTEHLPTCEIDDWKHAGPCMMACQRPPKFAVQCGPIPGGSKLSDLRQIIEDVYSALVTDDDSPAHILVEDDTTPAVDPELWARICEVNGQGQTP